MALDRSNTLLRLTSYLAVAALACVVALASRTQAGELGNTLYAAYGILAPSAAAFAGLVALTRYHSRPSPPFLLTGAGLIAAGTLDAFHGLFSLSDFSNLAVTGSSSTWTAGRLVLSVSLLLSVISRRYGPDRRGPFWSSPGFVYVAVALYIAAATLASLYIATPTLSRPGWPGRPMEFLSAGIFLAALLGYLREGRWRTDALDHWTVMALVVLLAAQAFFMAWSDVQYDSLANGGHFFALAGYVFLFVGLLVDMHRLFVNAERSAEDLGRVNQTLAAEIEQRRLAQAQLARLAETLEQRVAERTSELESSRLAALNIAEDAHDSRLAAERAAAALRRSEARVRAIVETAADAIVTLRSDGRIESFNPVAAATFGYSPEQAVGLNARELLAGDGASPPFWLASPASGAAEAAARDHLGRRSDGSTFPIELSVASMRIVDDDRSADEERFVAIIRDITQRRHIEQSARDAHAALARKYEEIEEFLSIIAHDLKHPVVGIKGLLTLVKEDLAGTMDSVSAQNIELCLTECERMRDLLSHLTQLGRIEGIKPRIEQARLDALVRACVDRFRARFQEQEVAVAVEAPAVEARIARSHIEEALINLIDNALKYGCPTPGSRLEVACRVNHATCEISVRDFGNGIDPRFHARIFQPFRRLVTNSSASGSGIGLTAVQRLMARIGGSVALESNIGQGAKFSLRFSLEPPEY